MSHETTEPHAIRALQELLAGRVPSAEDTSDLTGEVKACLDALTEALQADGIEAMRRVFVALSHDRPWLTRLASSQPPEQEQEERQPKRKIRFQHLSAYLNRPGQQWLIPEVLPRDGLTLVYGESGGYKSFLVMGWALCMATGTPWLGRAVPCGPVAYVAAEGGYGIGKRATAWLVHHQRFWKTSEELRQHVPLYLYDEPIVLQDPAHLAQVLTALTEDVPEPPLMVVIDTLSRCSAGADEVSNTEMARVLASADLIRKQFHCTVVIIHHEGKDKTRGPRGASALLANIETAILVTPTESGTQVESIKAKDAPRFCTLSLDAQPVRFGPMPDDASLVLVPSSAPGDQAHAPRLTDTQARMYALLKGSEWTYTQWLKAGKEAGLNERLTAEAITFLKRAGLVEQAAKRGPYTVVDHQEQERADASREEDEP